MAESELVQIASYATEVEAEYVRSLLRENGIHAYVDGAASNTMMSHVGTALGGVRLLTSSGNAEAAIEFLASIGDDSRSSDAAWFCGQCEETIDANFDVCWACGRERAMVEGQVPVPESETEPDRPIDADSKSQAVITSAPREPSHPYVPPGVADTATNQNFTTSSADDVDEMVLRAYRASLLGFILLPVITHAYSMYLLLRAAAQPGNLSPIGDRLWHRAFAITTIGCLMWIVLITVMLKS